MQNLILMDLSLGILILCFVRLILDFSEMNLDFNFLFLEFDIVKSKTANYE
mgnify:CR=1 FL=1